MIRNIRHIQIKKIAYHPNLYKAILTYEDTPTKYDESDDIEYMKYLESQNIECPHCKKMENKRRLIDKHER